MKKDDDIINEDAIKDLIKYAEDEESNTFEPPITEKIITEETEESIDEDNSPERISSKEENEAENTDNKAEKIAAAIKQKKIPAEEYITEEYDDIEDFEKDNSEKISKRGIIIGVTAGIIAVLLFIGVNSGTLSRFTDGFNKIFFGTTSNNELPTPRPDAEYNTQISSSVIVSFEGANNAEFVKYGKGIICAKMNYMSYINENGATEWEINTAIVDPILKANGDYILLAEKGRNKICLYNGNKLIYDADDPDSIVNADLSSKGDVVVVTDKSSYKGGISVYNKSGAQIFSWSSGSDMVMSADISASSRRVAVALLNTENTAKTTIQLFNVNEKESYSKIDIENTVIFDMQFTGNILNAFGDNRIVGISENGKITYNNTFDDVQLTHSSIDSNGNMLLSFDNGNMPMINMYNKKGVLKETVALAGVADFIDIDNKKILYNKGRDIYFGTINAKVMTKYTAAMDIKKLLLISDDTFVIIYSNSLETVTV